MLKYILSLSLPLYVLDQISKWLIVKNLTLGTENEVIPGFFWINHVANTGIAFGMFNGGENSNYIFGGIALLALVAIIILWKKGGFPGPISRFSGGLLIAGILGNVTDRFLYGYVVDFLKFDLGFMIWPSFNVADACICVAASLLILSSFIEAPEENFDSSKK